MQNSNNLSIPQMTRSTLNCDTTTTTTTLSPTTTNSLCSHELSPKNGTIKKTPIRRRSRASKKTPTTHLNADASNFRAIVQQFTGCHTANTFLGAHKGPINLSFGLDDNDDFERDNSITHHVSSFGYDCYCNNPMGTEKEKETKGGMLVSVDENKIFGSTSTTNSSSSPNMDILSLDDFELEDLCLSDFNGDDQLITENIWDNNGYLLI
ncbi:VQ motif-containing protein 22 [Solanum dulcamara]|uniref:VQ motif-containing protein 22 n=1 Tax=Solanum dulcamara TaxID=45834 RepID=UPI0024858752|nr:VQ motif-containing protein 22 [Solanum dulcamara]